MSIRRVAASTLFRQAAVFRGQPWGTTAGENGVDAATFAHLAACLSTGLELAWSDAPVPEIIRVERRQRLQTTFWYGQGPTLAKNTQVWDPETNKSWLALRDIAAFESANVPGSQPAVWAELKRDWSLDARNMNVATQPLTASVGEVWRWTGNGTVGGDYYYCLADCPAAYLNTAYLRPTYFYQLPDFNPDFARDASWHTPMGFVLGVWTANPELDDPATQALAYELTDDGVRVFEDPGSAWFRFTTVPPEITGSPWDANTAYAAGDQVYWQSGSAGDFYDVIVATAAGDTPVSAPSKFSRVEIPARYKVWLEYQLAADWYEFDGELEKSLAKRGLADREWKRLKYVLGRREQQSSGLNVQTR